MWAVEAGIYGGVGYAVAVEELSGCRSAERNGIERHRRGWGRHQPAGSHRDAALGAHFDIGRHVALNAAGSAAGRPSAQDRQRAAVIVGLHADDAVHLDAGRGMHQHHAVTADAGIGRNHARNQVPGGISHRVAAGILQIGDGDAVAGQHGDRLPGIDHAAVGDLSGDNVVNIVAEVHTIRGITRIISFSVILQLQSRSAERNAGRQDVAREVRRLVFARGERNNPRSGQSDLALGSRQRAEIIDVGAEHIDEARRPQRHDVGGDMGGDRRSGLDRHIAGDQGAVLAAGGIKQGKRNWSSDTGIEEIIVARGLIVGKIADVERRRNQRLHVDLRAGAENDAVAVDDIDRSESVDVPEDLAGSQQRIRHPVQCDPVGCGLMKIQRGVGADVERIPVQDRFRLILSDVDRDAGAADRLRRQSGAAPQCRGRRGQVRLDPGQWIAGGTTRRHQAADGQPVGNR